MRPLSWYAPLVPFGEFEIDLEPLMDAMPDCADGCMYVDFEVAPGKPKDVTHTIAWKQSAAGIYTKSVEPAAPPPQRSWGVWRSHVTVGLDGMPTARHDLRRGCAWRRRSTRAQPGSGKPQLIAERANA